MHRSRARLLTTVVTIVCAVAVGLTMAALIAGSFNLFELPQAPK